MPEVETKEYESDPGKEEDVIVKTGNFRIYFQNYYTIIAMLNDLLTGGLYFIGSLFNIFGAPAIIGQVLYLSGGFFLLMRPVLKIAHNIFIYDEEEYQQEVVDVGITEESNAGTREEERQESDDVEEEVPDREYNENYYGDSETQDEKKEEIKDVEN